MRKLTVNRTGKYQLRLHSTNSGRLELIVFDDAIKLEAQASARLIAWAIVRKQRVLLNLGGECSYTILADQTGIVGLTTLNSSLCGRQARDGNTEWTAGHIIQTYIMEELDGFRISTVLSTNGEGEIWVRAPSLSGGQPD